MSAGFTCRLGVVGLGFGSRLMLPFFERDPRVHLVAAADPRPEARAAFEARFGGRTFADATDLLTTDQIDAVYIATPTDLHAEHALLAASAGKHIVIEKPVAASLEDALRIDVAVREAGVHLVCGHTHAFDGPIRAMREIVHAGGLGALRSMVTWNANDYLVRPRALWDLVTERGGGVVFNQAPHQIDIVRTIAQAPIRSVRAQTQMGDARRPTEGGYHALFALADGSPVTAVYSGFGFFDTAELFGHWRGERGEVRAADTNARTRTAYDLSAESTHSEEDRQRDRVRFGAAEDDDDPASWDANPFFGMTLASCELGDVRQTPAGLKLYTTSGVSEVEARSSYADAAGAVIGELMDAIEHDVETAHGSRWALGTVEVCRAILDSAEHGGVVELVHQTG